MRKIPQPIPDLQSAAFSLARDQAMKRTLSAHRSHGTVTSSKESFVGTLRGSVVRPFAERNPIKMSMTELTLNKLMSTRPSIAQKPSGSGVVNSRMRRGSYAHEAKNFKTSESRPKVMKKQPVVPPRTKRPLQAKSGSIISLSRKSVASVASRSSSKVVEKSYPLTRNRLR